MQKKLINLVNRALAVSTLVALFFVVTPVYALSALKDDMTRQKVGELSSHDIAFNLGASNAFVAGETITFDLKEDNSGFVVSGATSVVADFDFNDGTERTVAAVNIGAPICSAGVNNVAIGIDDTTGVITVEACSTYTSSATGATVNLEFGTAAGGTDRVTNPGSATTVIIAVAQGTDTGQIAAPIITDDQIPVSATVNPSITFTVANTAFALGNLSSSSITTSGLNAITVGTNAPSGYTIKVQDLGNPTGTGNDGLWSIGASSLIASGNATLSAGTEGYGGQCAITAGSGSCAFQLTSAGEAVTGFVDDGTWPTFASYGSKPSGTDGYNIRVKAAISTSTTAGYYQDTLTLVATGNF